MAVTANGHVYYKIITNQCNPVKCSQIFEIQQNVLAKSWKSCECYKTLKICEPAIQQTKIIKNYIEFLKSKNKN